MKLKNKGISFLTVKMKFVEMFSRSSRT